MADRGSRLPQPFHFLRVEMNAVSQPCSRVQPTALLQIIERPAAIHLLTEFVLVFGLRQVGMQVHVKLSANAAGVAASARSLTEMVSRATSATWGIPCALMPTCSAPRARRCRRGSYSACMPCRQAAIRRRARLVDPARRAAARQPSRWAMATSRSRASKPGRKRNDDGRGGEAEEQLCHRHGDVEIGHLLGRQPRPYRIKCLQPRKQFAIERCRQRARQRLVEMVMGVDQPGQHDVVARLRRRRTPPKSPAGRPSEPVRRSCRSGTTMPRSAPSARTANGSLIQIARFGSIIPCLLLQKI